MAANINHLPVSKERLEMHSTQTLLVQLLWSIAAVVGQPNPYCPGGMNRTGQHADYCRELMMGVDLLYGGRVVPASMQAETLHKLHQGHQGIQFKPSYPFGGQRSPMTLSVAAPHAARMYLLKENPYFPHPSLTTHGRKWQQTCLSWAVQQGSSRLLYPQVALAMVEHSVVCQSSPSGIS